MTALTAPPRRRRAILIWLIVSQLLALSSLLIWAVVAGLSVMAFDSGEARKPGFCARGLGLPALSAGHGDRGMHRVRAPQNRLAVVLSGLTFAPPVLFYIFL
jgi:hypothetical protein